jgi:hypothetical protein
MAFVGGGGAARDATPHGRRGARGSGTPPRAPAAEEVVRGHRSRRSAAPNRVRRVHGRRTSVARETRARATRDRSAGASPSTDRRASRTPRPDESWPVPGRAPVRHARLNAPGWSSQAKASRGRPPRHRGGPLAARSAAAAPPDRRSPSVGGSGVSTGRGRCAGSRWQRGCRTPTPVAHADADLRVLAQRGRRTAAPDAPSATSTARTACPTSDVARPAVGRPGAQASTHPRR